jgi:cell volume regulation protein A
MAGAGLVTVLALPAVTTIDELPGYLLIGALVLVSAIVAVRLSDRSGFPSLLFYLGIGLALGVNGFGIAFDDKEITQVLGYSALVLILAEGGLTTHWRSIRDSVAPAAVLSTVGVVVSVGVVAVGAHVILDFTWPVSLLVGAIVSSTDAAAVFSVLRRVPLPRSIAGMLEAESGFNDAPIVILVLALAENAANPAQADPWWLLAVLAAAELVGGVVIGLCVGWLGGQLMRRVAGGSSSIFAIGILAITVLAYGAAAFVHTSGFLACYVAGLVLGNSRLPHQVAYRGFAAAVGWLAQIGLFVLLGLLATPAGFPRQIVPALVIGSILLLVARPLSVVASMTPFRMPWRTQAFLSWAGLRGAVPVVLATVPATVGTPGLGWIFDLVLVLVLIFTLIQAPSLPWVASRLGVVEPVKAIDMHVESTVLEDMRAVLLQVTVAGRSRLAGVRVFELRLPRGTAISLIVRDGVAEVPRETTVIRTGDKLLVVTPTNLRAQAEQRLREVSEGGRLAGWNRRSTPQAER